LAGALNKELCVLPLDLSPPFIGIDTGLRTGNKGIRSSENAFNLKVEGLEFRNTPVSTSSVSETYSHKIETRNGFSILAKKI